MDIKKVWKIKSADDLEELEKIIQQAQEEEWDVEKIDVKEMVVVISKKTTRLHD